MVLASTCASLPVFAAETRRLKQQLPPPTLQEVIDRHEGAAAPASTTDYVEATMAFYTRWVCQRVPFPDHVMSSLIERERGHIRHDAGYESNMIGNLRDWDVAARLGEIDLPVLVASGRYDEMTRT